MWHTNNRYYYRLSLIAVTQLLVLIFKTFKHIVSNLGSRLVINLPLADYSQKTALIEYLTL